MTERTPMTDFQTEVNERNAEALRDMIARIEKDHAARIRHLENTVINLQSRLNQVQQAQNIMLAGSRGNGPTG